LAVDIPKVGIFVELSIFPIIMAKLLEGKSDRIELDHNPSNAGSNIGIIESDYLCWYLIILRQMGKKKKKRGGPPNCL